ncbi:hypothetical protein LP420_18320 [Massilia sp. B-10]|nr:hypothetical protein LP420_18320 [Massilia sp. B-10]
MNKTLLALALLGAYAGTAQAQSSVTIYGNLDAKRDQAHRPDHEYRQARQQYPGFPRQRRPRQRDESPVPA